MFGLGVRSVDYWPYQAGILDLMVPDYCPKGRRAPYRPLYLLIRDLETDHRFDGQQLRLHPSLADAGVTVTRALRRAQWTQAACCAAHAPLASEGVQDTRECAGRCWGCLCTCGWRVGP